MRKLFPLLMLLFLYSGSPAVAVESASPTQPVSQLQAAADMASGWTSMTLFSELAITRTDGDIEARALLYGDVQQIEGMRKFAFTESYSGQNREIQQYYLSEENILYTGIPQDEEVLWSQEQPDANLLALRDFPAMLALFAGSEGIEQTDEDVRENGAAADIYTGEIFEEGLIRAVREAFYPEEKVSATETKIPLPEAGLRVEIWIDRASSTPLRYSIDMLSVLQDESLLEATLRMDFTGADNVESITLPISTEERERLLR